MIIKNNVFKNKLKKKMKVKVNNSMVHINNKISTIVIKKYKMD